MLAWLEVERCESERREVLEQKSACAPRTDTSSPGFTDALAGRGLPDLQCAVSLSMPGLGAAVHGLGLSHNYKGK